MINLVFCQHFFISEHFATFLPPSLIMHVEEEVGLQLVQSDTNCWFFMLL